MQRVINFSGGKTSAYMTIMEYKPGDIVLFCDTGREHEKTYKFIHDFEAHEGIPVIKITYGSKHEGVMGVRSDGKLGYIFPDVDITTVFDVLTNKRKGVPNQFKRFCTIELKIKTARRYLRSKGIRTYINLVGFRADEQHRIKRRKQMWKTVTDSFPLSERGIDVQQVNAYWLTKPYHLEAPKILGNCDLCPIYKGKDAALAILARFPETGDKWIADEDRSKMRGDGAKKQGHTYFEGVTIRQLRNIAQNNLFKEYDLNEIKPAFDCACTS